MDTAILTKLGQLFLGLEIGLTIRIIQKVEISFQSNVMRSLLVSASILVCLNVWSSLYWTYVDRSRLPLWVTGVVNTLWLLVEIASAFLLNYLIYVRYRIFADFERKAKFQQSLVILMTLSPLIVRLLIDFSTYACGSDGYAACKVKTNPFEAILYYTSSVLSTCYKLYYDWQFLLMFKPFLKNYEPSKDLFLSKPLIRFQYISYLVEILLMMVSIVFLGMQIAGIWLLDYIDPFKLSMSYAMLNIVDLKHVTIALFRKIDPPSYSSGMVSQSLMPGRGSSAHISGQMIDIDP